MSRPGNPWDNAACESFIKTLKYEEVYRTEYRDLAEARASIGIFLDKVYNQKRLPSALGYRPPAEFERGLLAQNKEAAARHVFPMRFLRHEEIYPFDEGAIPQDHALPHRTDEFPAGYSSADCSPALPASAYQPAAILQDNALAVQSNSSERRTVS